MTLRSPRRPGRSEGGRPFTATGRPLAAAPVLSAIGLVVVALLTASLYTGRIPFVRGGGGGGGGGGGIVDVTPAPSNVVIVDPRSKVPGSIVYAKAGNIWIQSGSDARQLTDGGDDAMPSWSADGAWIYYVETKTKRTLYPYAGFPVYYDASYPTIVRIRPDGSGREAIASGLFTKRGTRYQWFYWLRQPVPSRGGRTLAVMSDGPDPQKSDMVLQFIDVPTGKLRSAGLPENPPLGHQDPAWRPGTGNQPLLYVVNARDGTRGIPAIWRYDPAAKKTKPFSPQGYMGPAWSPDGRWVAATRQRGIGVDLVVLDGETGEEVARLTLDGRSWGATWSPAGDAIAFLHMENGIVDLRLVSLVDRDGVPAAGEVIDLTRSSGLDPASRPSWTIPADQLPPPSPTAAPSAPPPSAAP